MTVAETLEQVIDLYTKAGQMDYMGEPVSQLQHALQAAFLAEQAGKNDELILACLLHDIGHICALQHHDPLIGDFGISHHETIGANYLAQLGFSEKICILVASHVDAKRYLVSRQQDYYQKLSDASKETLLYQGGTMNLRECEKFKATPFFAEKIFLRTCDENAKQFNKQTPNLAHYIPKIELHLTVSRFVVSA